MTDDFEWFGWLMVRFYTPGKLTWNPKNGGWEDDFPLSIGQFLGSSRSFCMGGADLETKIPSFRCKEWRNPRHFHHICKLVFWWFFESCSGSFSNLVTIVSPFVRLCQRYTPYYPWDWSWYIIYYITYISLISVCEIVGKYTIHAHWSGMGTKTW